MSYWHPITDFSDYDIANERWAPIAGYEGYYSISTLGRVRSETRTTTCKGGRVRLRERIMRPTVDRYAVVGLRKNRRTECRLVHSLVAEAFLGDYRGKLMVNHIDSNKLNNRVENLEWTTRRGNARHFHDSKRTGLTGPERNFTLTDSLLPLQGLA